jgi:hypothetical protein
MVQRQNPFRVHGIVTDEFFTNRATELSQINRTLREPAAKLILVGARRMGKTSTLVRAIERHTARGGFAFLVDVSTATTLVDIANRILEGASRVLGKRWRDSINDFVSRIGVTLTLATDPATGMIVPGLDVGLRSAPLEEQRRSLAQMLDAVDGLAAQRGVNIGVVLDEFQEIVRFGGESAEWHLRGVMQQHQHMSYVMAGSQAHIIERMLDKGRAFYGLADLLAFGPMERTHLAAWIDDRMTGAGVDARGVGERIVSSVGPRTRDIILVARQCHDNGVATGVAGGDDVNRAIDDVVASQAVMLEALWTGLTALQQNVLRAVAADIEGLTTSASLQKFALSSSGSATNAANALVANGHLTRSESRTGYAFDSPFLRRWVEQTTLADVGVRVVPPDWRPPRSAEAR